MTGKRRKYLQSLLDRALWQDAYVFPRAMGKSERRSSAHMFWCVCVFYLWKGFKHKEKKARKGEKSLCWLVAFTLRNKFKRLLSVLFLKKKRKASFSFNYLQRCKKELAKQKETN